MLNDLTYEKLYETLHYDSISGLFTNKTNRGSRGRKGDVSAGKNANNYVQISIDTVVYQAHRLAWFYVYGYFPEHDIDHIDGIRDHNWILNLREASKQCNIRNSGNRKDNISGVKGVHFDKSRNKWLVSICINNNNHYIGRYNDFSEAVCARLAIEQCIGWDSCGCSSPAYQYVQKILANKIGITVDKLLENAKRNE